MSLPIYILKRCLQAVPLLFMISIMAFTLLKIAPIDPLASMRANPSVSQAAIKAEEERLGLNKPAPVQYMIWASSAITGNLGMCTAGDPVLNRLAAHAGNTLMLNIISLICTWAIALPAGIYAAIHRGKIVDKIFGVLAAMGMSMPTFLLSFLLLMVALATGLFPIGGLTSANYNELDDWHKVLDMAHHLIIPVTVLTCVSMAGIQRQVRSNLLDVLRADYVRTARAKGLPENTVIYKHALRNAINPLITLLGFEFAGLLSGAALTEMVLAYPGLGRLTLEGMLTKDMNLVMASMMLGAIMLIAGNLFADILLKITDPRITTD
ncbi:MAG: ABC transporter permease [Candidatus Obscuribacter sp.]|jgi:peptide/nickel transport system permease protein|nr:ABC transporter permease [Candidatus Obscuribacter sp.]MDQ5964585.1 transporter permease [Cyanobacteriota bacterium erpe_2018_sw_39hr_WHONDRS-SW48-000098_B_bin.30]MBK7839384.1 ABC transporter permease [Candidatus Obscuribacter sp.]MBK9203013.1 ABC transporter permease [Candidatus Obscuribacter sp.]MBK9619134.1 ABC transporter permease [Candidatus Obscuribacter sp.]